MVKVGKQFRYYILHSHSTIFVPSVAVKSILTQQEVAVNNKATWVSKVQEFDLKIKPTKLVRGQGLCRLVFENEEEIGEEQALVLFVSLTNSWFSNITYYLTYGECLEHLTGKAKRTLKLRFDMYIIMDDILYKKGLDDMFLRCVDKYL